MNIQNIYEIADWQVILCTETAAVADQLLPSFGTFRVTSTTLPLLCTMTLDLELSDAPQSEQVKICATGNGDIAVDRLPDGGYQFKIHNLGNEQCALLQTNQDFSHCRCCVYGTLQQQQFGLNNAMMLVYAFAGATQGTLLVHASLIRHRGQGYAFVAKSGTGKSTQTSNWLKVIPDCDLMNDDNPVLRVLPNETKAMIYGSPWSGKTPCYRQVKAPLAAITQIVRDPENFVKPVDPLKAFSELLASCSVMNWDKRTYHGICDTVTSAIERTPFYHLHCTADPISAQVCYETIGPHC